MKAGKPLGLETHNGDYCTRGWIWFCAAVVGRRVEPDRTAGATTFRSRPV
jgi:hypothetical protein